MVVVVNRYMSSVPLSVLGALKVYYLDIAIRSQFVEVTIFE